MVELNILETIDQYRVYILSITVLLTIINFIMQIWACLKNRKQKESDPELKNCPGNIALVIEDQQPNEKQPLLNNKDYQRKMDQNAQKGSELDGQEHQFQMVLQQNLQQELSKQMQQQNQAINEKLEMQKNEFQKILEKLDKGTENKIQVQIKDVEQKIQHSTINFDEKLKNIDKLKDCKLMYDQIENIKISIQKYEAKYEEDFKTFNDNFMVFYKNNPENQKKVRDLLLQLYESTNKQRQVEDQFKLYVRQVQDKSGLKKNYNLTIQSVSQLSKYCNAFREVRGDGNCFYTAFGYQFLYILLFHYSFDQFVQFIEKIKTIELPMKIFIEQKDFKIDDKEIEKTILKEFLYRLIRLKSIKDIELRQKSLLEQFAAYEQQSDEVDSCLYALSTIFFRNYSNYVIENSEVKDAIDDKINLLIWELECNNNELVISELAKSLDMQIINFYLFFRLVTLIFFNKQEFQNREYGNKEKSKIVLLIKPGHYNIGLLKQETESDKLIQKNKSIQEESNKIINLTQDYKETYEQYIQESSNLKVIVTNLLDYLQKGQLPEIEVRNLKKGLSEKQQ